MHRYISSRSSSTSPRASWLGYAVAFRSIRLSSFPKERKSASPILLPKVYSLPAFRRCSGPPAAARPRCISRLPRSPPTQEFARRATPSPSLSDRRQAGEPPQAPGRPARRHMLRLCLLVERLCGKDGIYFAPAHLLHELGVLAREALLQRLL